ncbi:MAG: hypothetical protein LBQ22_03295 [Bacteroidales bacterium]|jgi:hypothetical protein|nr:hypothetical protein [Bacteroidales bacterium]
MENENQDSGKFIKFIKRNKMSSFLFILLIIVIVWALISNYVNKRNTNKEIASITASSKNKIDSIRETSVKQTMLAFSWAVRSEMIRNNLDQVDQFFTSFIRESQVLKILLVDPSTQKVLLSTDKKDEGIEFPGAGFISDNITIQDNETYIRAIAPVSGLNGRLGILIIDFSK